MLEIKNLTCGYRKDPVLRQVSLSVDHGGFVGVIGPNGSGKTTLLKVITKIITPWQGEVSIEGVNVHRLTYKDMACKVAVVSQMPAPGSRMSVEEFVLLGRIPWQRPFQFLETKEDMVSAFDAMVLTDTFRLRQRSIADLSAGERQLVLVARALSQNPRILILDEPTNHLDITHQVAILDLVKKLNRQRKITVIAVLHDLNLASEYCDRLVLINQGMIYKSGLPAEVLTYPIIEAVYKTCVVVKDNPVSKRPYVFLVSGEVKSIAP